MASRPIPRSERAHLTKCRVCKCTEVEPCNPPCSWAEPGLCSTCSGTIAALCNWYEDALQPRLASLLREFKARRDSPFAAVSRMARGARR